MLKWFHDNSMEANPCKFQSLLCKPARACNVELKVEIAQSTIPSQSSIKTLGVIVDHKLNFQEHIDSICKKASQQVNAMRRMYKYLDQKSRNAIYNSFIKSNFNYCPIVWMFASKTDLLKLESIQVRALRFVYRDLESSKQEILLKSNE